ncbi:MAG TPA: formimidoylglutamase [Flavobacteriaceae bacterium]|nr:formimidoylglutamase [Flavobacteriaceae bacterium]
MNKLNLFTNTHLKSYLQKRAGEVRFGEQVKLLTSVSNIYDQLVDLDVDHVIIGLPEDVGVFANYGKTGTYKAWDVTLKILLNIQSNQFTKANKTLLLGHLDFSKELKACSQLDQSVKKDVQKARKLVADIDKVVSNLVSQVVKAGKKPILIGGGHNNAYGNIKGTALGLNTAINAINFDVHSDFRREEGRHSGNGFSYAYTEGFLKKYFVFGLQENYTSQEVFFTMDKIKSIKYNTFEGLRVRNELQFTAEMENALNFIGNEPFGIEIDCDAIENIPSSAMTPSGFKVSKAREFVHHFAKHPNATYIHICEAAPTPETETLVGKLITYLITDFIRAHAN